MATPQAVPKSRPADAARRRAGPGPAVSSGGTVPPLVRASGEGNRPTPNRGSWQCAWPALLGALYWLAGCVGCTTASPTAGPTAGPPIQELNVLSMPVALNLDGKDGADGIAIKVFAGRQDEPKAVPIQDGNLEIVAYDGNLDATPGAKPFRTWRLSAAELAERAFTTALGTGYNLVLSWAPQHLTQARVVVLARYLPPRGPPVLSSLSSIADIVR